MAAYFAGPAILKKGATAVGEVTDLNISQSANKIPTTPHKTTDRYEESIVGIIVSSVTGRVNFARTDATHAAMQADVADGSLDSYSITLNAETGPPIVTFSARALRFDIHLPATGEQSADFELAVSGAHSWA